MVTLTEIGIFRIADGKISGKLDYFSSARRQLPSPSNQRPPGTQLTNREGRRELLALVACWWRAR